MGFGASGRPGLAQALPGTGASCSDSDLGARACAPRTRPPQVPFPGWIERLRRAPRRGPGRAPVRLLGLPAPRPPNTGDSSARRSARRRTDWTHPTAHRSASTSEASDCRCPTRRSGGRGGPLRVALRQRSREPPKGQPGRRARGAQARASRQSPTGSRRYPGGPPRTPERRRCRGCYAKVRPARAGPRKGLPGLRDAGDAEAATPKSEQLAPAPGRASPASGTPVPPKPPSATLLNFRARP